MEGENFVELISFFVHMMLDGGHHISGWGDSTIFNGLGYTSEFD